MVMDFGCGSTGVIPRELPSLKELNESEYAYSNLMTRLDAAESELSVIRSALPVQAEMRRLIPKLEERVQKTAGVAFLTEAEVALIKTAIPCSRAACEYCKP